MVIAIIGILASIALGSLNSARDSARKATAKAQLRAIRSGIALLEADTGKWPNGCPVGNSLGNNEYSLNTTNAGLVSTPTVSSDPPCGWTAGDIAAWKGPYITATIDPWGRPYYFDPDYRTDGSVREDCPSVGANTGLPQKTVIMSGGINGTNGTSGEYDCDDIVYMLYEGTLVP